MTCCLFFYRFSGYESRIYDLSPPGLNRWTPPGLAFASWTSSWDKWATENASKLRLLDSSNRIFCKPPQFTVGVFILGDGSKSWKGARRHRVVAGSSHDQVGAAAWERRLPN